VIIAVNGDMLNSLIVNVLDAFRPLDYRQITNGEAKDKTVLPLHHL